MLFVDINNEITCRDLEEMLYWLKTRKAQDNVKFRESVYDIVAHGYSWMVVKVRGRNPDDVAFNRGQFIFKDDYFHEAIEFKLTFA